MIRIILAAFVAGAFALAAQAQVAPTCSQFAIGQTAQCSEEAPAKKECDKGDCKKEKCDKEDCDKSKCKKGAAKKGECKKGKCKKGESAEAA